MSILNRYSTIMNEAIRARSTGKERTLLGWQNDAKNIRAAMLEIKRQHEEKLQDLRDTYSPRKFAEMRVPLDNEYTEMKSIAIRTCRERLAEVLDGKQTQFQNCNKAPSAENIRMLQVLQMRDSLTVSDIAEIASQFSYNIPSLRALSDICKQKGIAFPHIKTIDELEDELERAGRYAEDNFDSIDKDLDELNYWERCFWEYPGTGRAAEFFAPLDETGFTVEQINEAQNEKGTGTKSTNANSGDTNVGEWWAEVKCNNGMNASVIANQFHVSMAQIREANPGKDIDHLYSGDLILVPSTKFSFSPDPSGAHVQPDMVRPVPRPVYKTPTGPNGESVGDDINISPPEV